jgi:hypothetical protein
MMNGRDDLFEILLVVLRDLSTGENNHLFDKSDIGLFRQITFYLLNEIGMMFKHAIIEHKQNFPGYPRILCFLQERTENIILCLKKICCKKDSVFEPDIENLPYKLHFFIY